jgi:hypothetical protein
MANSSSSIRDIVYLRVLASNSPLDFTGHIGKINDYTNYDNFIYKLNKWCEDNPHSKNLNFTTQDSSILVNKNQIYEQLRQKHNPQNTSTILLPCLVKYKSPLRPNEMWARANVLDINREKQEAKLFLIDEGILEIFPFSKIRLEVPSFINDIEAKAKHFRLGSAEYESSLIRCTLEANMYFFELIIKNRCFQVNTFVKSKNTDSSATLFYYSYKTDLLLDSNESLLEHLISKGFISINHPYKDVSSDGNIINFQCHDNETESDDSDDFMLVHKKV